MARAASAVPVRAAAVRRHRELGAAGPGRSRARSRTSRSAVGDRVYFDYDSSVLSPTATQTLDKQAAWLKRYPDIIVTVEGHTDERGTREYNLALGDRRANAVKNYLVALQINPDRVLTISYGEERPVDPGHDEAAWAKNRRAVTVVTTTQ